MSALLTEGNATRILRLSEWILHHAFLDYAANLEKKQGSPHQC